MLIEYVRIACVIVLINTSRLVFKINFSFHPSTFFVIFSQRSLKVLIFYRPPTIGSPKIFFTIFHNSLSQQALYILLNFHSSIPANSLVLPAYKNVLWARRAIQTNSFLKQVQCILSEGSVSLGKIKCISIMVPKFRFICTLISLLWSP